MVACDPRTWAFFKEAFRGGPYFVFLAAGNGEGCTRLEQSVVGPAGGVQLCDPCEGPTLMGVRCKRPTTDEFRTRPPGAFAAKYGCPGNLSKAGEPTL